MSRIAEPRMYLYRDDLVSRDVIETVIVRDSERGKGAEPVNYSVKAYLDALQEVVKKA